MLRPIAGTPPSPRLSPFLRSLSLVLLLSALPSALPAQQPGEPAPAVVTQEEQNRLRAEAFRAEREGRFAAAADAFGSLYRAAPERIDWAIATGRCLGRAGRFGDALELLETAHKRWPTDLEVTAMLARTLLLQTEREPGTPYPQVLWAEAAELAEGVLRVDPDHEDSRLLLAQARYLLGQWDDAVAQAEEAARRHPDRPGAHVLLGRIATDRFRALLQQYERERPTGQEEGELVGAIHAQRTRARASFEKAAELDPTRAYPHVALSRLAELDGKRDEAKAHLLDALAIDPNTQTNHDLLTDGMDWQQRQRLYRDLRERFAATTALTGRLRDTRTATLWFHEGRARLDGRDYAGARAAFERALELDDDADNNHYYAFLACYYQDDHDAAERNAAAYARVSAPGFADVLRALPDDQRVQIAAMIQYLGDRAFQKGRIDSSRDLNHVVACLKDSADAWNNHAFLCRETQRYEQAYQSYLHALEREPTSPQLWNDAAVVLQYHLTTPEHLEKARQMYEKALELSAAVLADPDADAGARAFAREAADNAKKNLLELDKKS